MHGKTEPNLVYLWSNSMEEFSMEICLGWNLLLLLINMIGEGSFCCKNEEKQMIFWNSIELTKVRYIINFLKILKIKI